jgi:hypothetical protein
VKCSRTYGAFSFVDCAARIATIHFRQLTPFNMPVPPLVNRANKNTQKTAQKFTRSRWLEG